MAYSWFGNSLTFYPGNALSGISWAEYNPRTEGTFTAHFGSSGVALGMTIIVNWSAVLTACQAILGYSQRVVVNDGGGISRQIPFQHPIFSQLYAKDITSVTGIKMSGVESSQFGALLGGEGLPNNAGPTAPSTVFAFALITIAFWRPPYYVRTDTDIVVGGIRQEYLRYVDKKWTIQSKVLTRESQTFFWRDNNEVVGVPDSVGTVVSHMKVSRTWYEVPEQCIFEANIDKTLNGLPANLLYTQTETTNPITTGVSTGGAGNFFYQPGMPIVGCVNVMKGGAMSYVDVAATTTAGSPDVTVTSGASIVNGMVCTGWGIPRGTTVISGAGTASLVLSQNAQFTYPNAGLYATLAFELQSEMFFGCPTGTLLLEGIEITPRPLQLPPALMQIPPFVGSEPLSQVQYDVTFHFDYFDPPNGPKEAFRGHNLMPYAGDTLWYSAYAQLGTSAVTSNGPFTTRFNYADFSDLFLPL